VVWRLSRGTSCTVLFARNVGVRYSLYGEENIAPLGPKGLGPKQVGPRRKEEGLKVDQRAVREIGKQGSIKPWLICLFENLTFLRRGKATKFISKNKNSNFFILFFWGYLESSAIWFWANFALSFFSKHANKCGLRYCLLIYTLRNLAVKIALEAKMHS